MMFSVANSLYLSCAFLPGMYIDLSHGFYFPCIGLLATRGKVGASMYIYSMGKACVYICYIALADVRAWPSDKYEAPV